MAKTAHHTPRMDSPFPDATPGARMMAAGKHWRVSEYICTAGPEDRPFEERHDHFTIAAVIEGSFNYRADTGRGSLHPGAFLLGNFGACYECGHDHGTGDRCVAFQFSPEFFAEIAADVAGTGRFRFSAAMLPALPQILPWLTWIETCLRRADIREIDESVPALLAAVVRVVSGSSPAPVNVTARDQRRVREALRYVELNSGEALDLDDLANVSGMSKYHFLRTFRRVIGMTPYQFLLSVRMRRAALQLATSSDPVSRIAFEAGFGDLSTFNGRFHDTFGVNPRSYRQWVSRTPNGRKHLPTTPSSLLR